MAISRVSDGNSLASFMLLNFFRNRFAIVPFVISILTASEFELQGLTLGKSALISTERNARTHATRKSECRFSVAAVHEPARLTTYFYNTTKHKDWEEKTLILVIN